MIFAAQLDPNQTHLDKHCIWPAANAGSFRMILCSTERSYAAAPSSQMEKSSSAATSANEQQ
jgi:hypothetical protein